MKIHCLTFVSAMLMWGCPAMAMEVDALERLLEQRLGGDRSGVCVAVAHVAADTTYAFHCADQAVSRVLDVDSRFEIGSVSKAMQGTLVARLVEQGRLDVETPLAQLLPASVAVPQYGDEPIRLRHLLTHTSGLPRLPSRLAPADPENPYVDLTEEQLLDSLGDVELRHAPDQVFEYSNFGAMLLSLALVRHTGEHLADLMRQEIFEPLGMQGTGLDGDVIQGHDARGNPVSMWDLPPDMGGVGGVRSTPGDMARWLGANLGQVRGEAATGYALAGEELINASGQSIGWGWLRIPVNDRMILAHDGGTGGFSSFVAIDPDAGTGVVVLTDTSMAHQNSLGDLALHLLDSSVPLGAPQVWREAPAELNLHDYTGRYPLYDGDQPFMDDFVLAVTVDDGELVIQGSAQGNTQPALPVEPEGEDRFVLTSLDVEITFLRDGDGKVHALDFRQGPLRLSGQRHAD